MRGNIKVDNNKTDDDVLELPKRNYNFLTKKLGPMHKSVKFRSVKKGKISNRVLENLLLDDDNDHSEKEDDQNINFKYDDNDFENDDYEEINFASLNFNDKLKRPNTTNNNHMHCWILL